MELTSVPTVNPLDSRLSAATQGRRNGTPEQARQVAREFEAMMVGMMLKSMRDTVSQDKLTGGGRAEETFRSMLDQEYASAATRNGGIGLARMIERELMANGVKVRSAAPASAGAAQESGTGNPAREGVDAD